MTRPRAWAAASSENGTRMTFTRILTNLYQGDPSCPRKCKPSMKRRCSPLRGPIPGRCPPSLANERGRQNDAFQRSASGARGIPAPGRRHITCGEPSGQIRSPRARLDDACVHGIRRHGRGVPYRHRPSATDFCTDKGADAGRRSACRQRNHLRRLRIPGRNGWNLRSHRPCHLLEVCGWWRHSRASRALLTSWQHRGLWRSFTTTCTAWPRCGSSMPT